MFIFTLNRIFKLPEYILRMARYVRMGIVEKIIVHKILRVQKTISYIGDNCSGTAKKRSVIVLVSSLFMLILAVIFRNIAMLAVVFAAAFVLVVSAKDGLRYRFGTAKGFAGSLLMPYALIAIFSRNKLHRCSNCQTLKAGL
jgi:hypothetical protein